MNTQPIKPSEVTGVKPDEVVAAFNELIEEKWDGAKAEVLQEEAVERIMYKMNVASKTFTREQIFSKGYLNIETLYRKNGWKVEYDKPGYNENYPASFIFSQK
jgi:hypothetical protein